MPRGLRGIFHWYMKILELLNVCGSRTFGTVNHFEADPGPFIQGFVTLGVNC